MPPSSKLAVLEAEFLRTAEELGRTKKLLEDKSRLCEELQATAATTAPPAAPVDNNRYPNVDVQQLIRDEVSKLMSQQKADVTTGDNVNVNVPNEDILKLAAETAREQLLFSDAMISKLKSDLERSQDETMSKARLFEREREDLIGRLHREFERSAQLSGRIIALEAEAQKPLTPQQQHFNVSTIDNYCDC